MHYFGADALKVNRDDFVHLKVKKDIKRCPINLTNGTMKQNVLMESGEIQKQVNNK